MEANNKCPICSEVLVIPTKTDFNTFAAIQKCSNCGPFGIYDLQDLSPIERIASGILLKKKQYLFPDIKSKTPIVTKDILDAQVDELSSKPGNTLLPDFLTAVCSNFDVGSAIDLSMHDLAVLVETRDYNQAKWCVQQARDLGWLSNFIDKSSQDGPSYSYVISARGWQADYENRKDSKKLKSAFLALQFNNEDLKKIILPKLKSASKRTGYNLLAVNEKRKAGLIDNKIRTDIRNSRFLIVDISDQNPGAYFEAGFAEGLGKPVFYICDKIVFDQHHNREGGKKTVHFDVEHHDIIIWDSDNPNNVEDELVASIRNTLPDEAIMIDESD